MANVSPNRSLSSPFLLLTQFTSKCEPIFWQPVTEQIIPPCLNGIFNNFFIILIFQVVTNTNLPSKGKAKIRVNGDTCENVDEKMPHNFHCRLILESGSRGANTIMGSWGWGGWGSWRRRGVAVWWV